MILALLATMAVASSYPDPLAPAADGKMQCYTPNAERKTCRSIGAYSANGDGTFTNTATILLSSEPVIVMESLTPVSIKAGAVCGTLKAEQVAAARLTMNGKALPAEEAQPILTQISTAMQNVFGKEICTTYVPSGEDFVTKVTIDGAASWGNDTVKRVAPGDGYTVAP